MKEEIAPWEEVEQSRPLPANLDAERLVLGSVLLNGDLFAPVSAALTPDDFSIVKHWRIFARMAELAARGERIDRVMVAGELMKVGQLESVGGLSYLCSLDEGLPEIANLDGYVRIVQDKAVLRRCAFACQATLDEALSRGGESAAVVGRLRTLADSLRDCIASGDIPNVAEAVQIAGPAEIFGEGHSVLVRTPWRGLNQIVGGFERGQMVVIGARPSMGKTVMACQIAVHAAEQGKQAAIFSLEMSNVALIQRFIASSAGIPLYSVRGGHMDAMERARAQMALAGVCDMENLALADKAYTIPAIRAALARLSRKRKPDVVVIDYLQLLNPVGRHSNRVAEITEISRGVKLLSQEFDCALVVASQLSRESEKENREPRLSDLRDSGSIEQDADLVIFPHRIPGQEAEERHVRSEFIVAKQRNGRLGRVPVVFEKPFVRFTESA